MKVFVDRDCLLHDPPYEILSGKPVPYFESPARWHAIKHELESSPSFEIADRDSDVDVLGYAQAIHDRDYIQYLRNAYEDWVADGNDKARSQSLETFQYPKLLSPLPSIDDSAEALSPIAKAVDLQGITQVHHSAEAIASLTTWRPPSDSSKLLVPLKCHRKGRGNLIDPGACQWLSSILTTTMEMANDYPYFTGSTKEKGSGMGIGCNINFPLPRGTTDQKYCETLREAVACVQQFEPEYG
ncbi:hypothetical protein HETIRDRAFT_99089 [Heterobasidion irregulare TC 32-1]|uniref:Histone deacetylase domain-containing protein n=1 Tax=Heterobasidion irregulare (strain TC 32-1) TaxID=747525 RepID=W4KLB5_HETIT|nr:uncharacterized protein HETIRDRAFT_99089 [Heterobasidion irregulare TC 32-1]ETW86617.1 hypothetical protein HETIRDRAFT_99089 [Heterobasidion irregulare TC 32-1]